MIYRLHADVNHFQNLTLKNSKDWREFRKFDGTKLEATWESPFVQVLIDEGYNRCLPESDFPGLASHVPVFSRKAADVLKPLISPYGEYHRLDCREHELYAFNVTTVVDGLDLERSEYKCFEGSKRIMRVIKHVFIPSVVETLPIFKLAQLTLVRPFVNDSFVELVKQNRLTGFRFVPTPENPTRGGRFS